MDLIDYSIEETMSREAAADRLRDLADQLSRHNKVTFEQEGRRYTVDVPDQVNIKLEIEIGESSEIEFEISW